MTRPLDGLIVVALEQAVAAPFCTMRLADAGARVIKLERPEGDFARGYDDVAVGQSSYFVWLNRGKESVVVDLRRESDRALFLALIAEADVFIQYLKPGAIDRMGYSVDSLCQKHPRLIGCSISGFGENRPIAELKACDFFVPAKFGPAAIPGVHLVMSGGGFSLLD